MLRTLIFHPVTKTFLPMRSAVFIYVVLLLMKTTTVFSNDPDSLRVKRFKFYPFPAIGYAPETRWYAGAVTLFNFRTTPDTLFKPASVQLEFNITQNKQWILTAGYEIRLKNDEYLLTGENGYYDFPEYYWENGIDSDDDDKFNYESKRLELDNTFYKKIFTGTYAGLRYRYHQVRIDSSDISLFPPETKAKQTASGIGGTFLLDTRDALFYPEKGWLITCSVLLFDERLGGNYHFEKIDTDVRAYTKIKKNGVLAWQLLMINTTTPAPFRMQPAVGGESSMRGYYYGRFRDEQLVATQLEYRHEFKKRFGAVAFAGTGTVYSLNNNNPNTFRLLPNYGIGLRYKIDKKDHVNLRFDYGFGKEMSGFYVSFGEAF